MFYIIYQTTNKINGKIYIGKHETADLDDAYLGSGRYLQKAILKYGVENFQREILHVLKDEAEMNAKEREIVNEEFLQRDDVYNLKLGGDGGFDFLNRNKLNNSNKDWEQHSRNSSNNAKAMFESRPELRKQLSDRNKEWHKLGKVSPPTFAGHKHSEEWKANKSAEMKVVSAGSNNSQFGTMWITNGSQNRKIKKTDAIPSGWSKGRTI